MEKYSSGWRGAPAKGIDGLRRARVQIPPSPLNEKKFKKTVDIEKNLWYDIRVASEKDIKRQKQEETLSKRFEKS